MTDWWSWLTLVAVIFVALYACSALVSQRDKECERRIVYARALADVVEATDYQEPTRTDANDPLRIRFVFCGRWTESGHAPECPWQVAVRRVHVLEPR